jgi:benzoyl-CoA reductase/2-hydroxyglutaryl-CoA dehydratase subunit BcrC/BadD/HgdB
MAEEKKVERKQIETSKLMKKVMADYFFELDAASKDDDQKVAYCTSVGPAELLYAMDFKVHFPENHGAMLGSTRLAMDYIPVANAKGYSPEICSYLTSDVGALIKGETPLTRVYDIKSIPKPDVVVYNTNQCRDVQEWFSYYAKHFNVPILGVNSPRAIPEELAEYYIKDVENQIENMVPTLEKVTGTEFEETRLKESVKLSLEATLLWKDVLQTATHVPSPLTFFDGSIHMGPVVVLRGTQVAVDYYKTLKTELEDRIKNNIAAIEDEQFRLYWEGMPIWGKLRSLSNLFIELKSCIVASTYCNSWIFDSFDPNKPFYSMAKAYSEIFINRSENVKEKYIEEMTKKYQLDGIIYHDSKTCPNNSNSRYGMPERLQNKIGIPYLVINGDLNDLRCYSEEQAKTNIEAFIEQLKESK